VELDKRSLVDKERIDLGLQHLCMFQVDIDRIRHGRAAYLHIPAHIELDFLLVQDSNCLENRRKRVVN